MTYYGGRGLIVTAGKPPAVTLIPCPNNATAARAQAVEILRRLGQ